jgi:hypothetical protein
MQQKCIPSEGVIAGRLAPISISRLLVFCSLFLSSDTHTHTHTTFDIPALHKLLSVHIHFTTSRVTTETLLFYTHPLSPVLTLLKKLLSASFVSIRFLSYH